uniref:MH1 domain-containing protein n=1 Tax=Ditylenchus dipsaci TaxID=166011 RepID=A0A915EL28_9BILA
MRCNWTLVDNNGRAVKKKLRKNKCLEELERAITSEDPSTGCTKRAHNLRWPDENISTFYILQTLAIPRPSDASPVEKCGHCLHPFNKSQRMDQICINPYHYELIEPPRNPRVIVKKNCSDQGFGCNNFSVTRDTDALSAESIPNMTLTFEETMGAEQMLGSAPANGFPSTSSTAFNSNGDTAIKQLPIPTI